jgi:diguanylate cyclase (GGDEF)-like protein
LKRRRDIVRSRVAQRIVALFVLCALVPVLAMSILSYERVRHMLAEHGSTQLARLDVVYSTLLYDRLLNAQALLNDVSSTDALAYPWTDEYRDRLAVWFDAIAILRQGTTPRSLLGFSEWPAPSTAEQAQLARGGAVLHTQDGSDGTTTVLMERLLDPAHPDDGIVAAALNTGHLVAHIAELDPATDLCLLSEHGSVLYCSRPDGPPELLQRARERSQVASGSFEYTFDGELNFAHHRELFFEPRFLVRGWTVIASRPASSALAPLDDFATILVPAVVLSLLVAALLSLTQVRRTLGPLKQLIDGTRRAGDQDFSARVPVAGNDEFSELANSFNTMNARLGSQFTTLTTLAEIDRAILTRLDVDSVIDAVVVRIRDVVKSDFVSVAMLDRTATGMMQIHTRGASGGDHARLDRAACPARDTLELLLHPGGIWLDTHASPKSYAIAVTVLGATRAFASPIVWQDQVVGIVVLGFAGEGSLTEDEMTRTRDLGDRIGVAFAATAKDEQLYYQAHYDQLTGLPNRLYFRDQLDRALARARRHSERCAVLFVDLDYFKRINDSLGHLAGDQVLQIAAERMRSCIRGTDILARLGGDEFTILQSGIESSHDAGPLADALIRALSVPFVISGQDHYLNASIGIALYPGDGVTTDELLRNADTAMYRAKENGRGQFIFFENRMNADAVARVRSERELRHAIDRNEFVLVYQPQIDLATGRISGAEALVRWNHPERGQLVPAHFIQLAEETGLIERLGEWVMRDACAQFKRWRRDGVALPRLGINVSPRQFRQPTFSESLHAIIGESGIPPEMFEIEITESLFLESTSLTESVLARLKSIGVLIALDDFGTGYSSLAYLRRLPVDIVKIDRSFIKDLPADKGSAAITAAIIGMAHALNMEIVAEGVETVEQMEFLRGLHCECVQGYHVSTPLAPDDLVQFIKRTDARSRMRAVASDTVTA